MRDESVSYRGHSKQSPKRSMSMERLKTAKRPVWLESNEVRSEEAEIG